MRVKWYWTKVHDHPMTSQHPDTTSWYMQAVFSVPLTATWRGCLLRVAPQINLASHNFLWFWVHYHHTLLKSKDLTSVTVAKITGLKEGGHTITEICQLTGVRCTSVKKYSRLFREGGQWWTTTEETSLWPSTKDLKTCYKQFETNSRGHTFNHTKEGERTKCCGLPRGVCTSLQWVRLQEPQANQEAFPYESAER